jgi:rare lipoprotein A
MNILRLALLAVLVVSLSACTEARLASHVIKQNHSVGSGAVNTNTANAGNFKIGKPYQVQGQWYYPKEQYELTETGIASWYGPGFQGKMTASGETFDTRELTAAHRTLQMPSLVRVTNLDNGKVVIVRVNDRGPFKKSRVIDLSQRAAELLEFKNIGTARVKLEVLTQESLRLAEIAKSGTTTKGMETAYNTGRAGSYQTASLAPVSSESLSPQLQGHNVNGKFYPDPVVQTVPVTKTSLFIQVGAFSNADNANALVHKLSHLGNVSISKAYVGGQHLQRVRIGPIASTDQADAVLNRAISAGHNDAIIIVE